MLPNLKTRITTVLLLSSQLLSASACLPPTSNQTNPNVIHGPDCPADPATLGYFNNHFSLIVRNLTASIEFYTKVFGFRHLFTFPLSSHFSFTYLGHAQGGKNGSGYQLTAEMIREKNNRQGLIELQFYDSPAANANLTASTQVPNTFSHIGIVVPDLNATLARCQQLGVHIVTKPGDGPPPVGGELVNALGGGSMKADDPEAQMVLNAFKQINQGLIFVTDPDGNLIEIQPQEEKVDF